jgi:hypothetical protein
MHVKALAKSNLVYSIKIRGVTILTKAFIQTAGSLYVSLDRKQQPDPGQHLSPNSQGGVSIKRSNMYLEFCTLISLKNLVPPGTLNNDPSDNLIMCPMQL